MRDVESVDHLFLHYSYTFEIWGLVLQKWDFCWTLPRAVKEFVHQWNPPSRNPFIKKLWSFVFPHMAWGLWKERNNRIFRNIHLPPNIVFKKISRAIFDNLSTVSSNVLSHSGTLKEYEANVVKDWDFGHHVVTPKVNPRDNIGWNFPPQGWVKINFDGAARGFPSQAGCGGVIQDHYGNFISAIALPLGKQTNNVAEAIGAYHSLKLAKKNNFKLVWVKGDAKNIINYLKGKSTLAWNVDIWMKKAKDIIKTFDRCIIVHVYRQANVVANFLANRGVTCQAQLSWTRGDRLDSEFVMHLFHERSQGSKFNDNLCHKTLSVSRITDTFLFETGGQRGHENRCELISHALWAILNIFWSLTLTLKILCRECSRE